MTITILLIIVNVIVFVMMEILGDTQSVLFMLEHGAMYPTNILEMGEYWRFITAMFLHFGFEHLINNMVMLGAAGRILEAELGKIKYVLLYVMAGIGGNVLSFLQMVICDDYAVSAGASGAVFGIVGGLVWIVIVHKGRYQSLTGKGLIFMIGLCLYYGITAGNVDNWGHIGGLIMGVLMGILCYRKPKWKMIDFEEENLYT